MQSVTTVPPTGEHEITHLGRSETFWKESLIATLCFFPTGIVSLCYSMEVRKSVKMLHVVWSSSNLGTTILPVLCFISSVCKMCRNVVAI